MRAQRDFADHWYLFTFHVKQSPAPAYRMAMKFRNFNADLAVSRFLREAPPNKYQLLAFDWYETEPLIDASGYVLNRPSLSRQLDTLREVYLRSPRANRIAS